MFHARGALVESGKERSNRHDMLQQQLLRTQRFCTADAGLPSAPAVESVRPQPVTKCCVIGTPPAPMQGRRSNPYSVFHAGNP